MGLRAVLAGVDGLFFELVCEEMGSQVGLDWQNPLVFSAALCPVAMEARVVGTVV